MQAVFATTQIVDRDAPFLDAENTTGFEERVYLEKRRTEFSENLRELNSKQASAAKAWAAERGFEYIPRGV
jgi:hypothetical protein